MSESYLYVRNALFLVIFSFPRLSFSMVNLADPDNLSPGFIMGLQIFPRLSFRRQTVQILFILLRQKCSI